MPIARSLYRSLEKQHGPEKGREMYAAMENEAKHGKRPSFLKALATAKREGHELGLGLGFRLQRRKKN